MARKLKSSPIPTAIDDALGAVASLSPPERTFRHSHQTSARSKSSAIRCVHTTPPL